jgi:uncharacterized protein
VGIADEKYMLLTTFRRNGTPVAAPVWVVALDGDTFGFATSTASGKAKRLAHSGHVTVQACDMRGRITAGSSVIEGTARTTTGPEYLTIKSKVRAKYGYMVTLTKTLGAIGSFLHRKPMPYADLGVVITPS